MCSLSDSVVWWCVFACICVMCVCMVYTCMVCMYVYDVHVVYVCVCVCVCVLPVVYAHEVGHSHFYKCSESVFFHKTMQILYHVTFGQ